MTEILCPECGEEMLYFWNVTAFVCSDDNCKGFIDVRTDQDLETEKEYDEIRQELHQIREDIEKLEKEKMALEQVLKSPEYRFVYSRRRLRERPIDINNWNSIIPIGIYDCSAATKEQLRLALDYKNKKENVE